MAGLAEVMDGAADRALAIVPAEGPLPGGGFFAHSLIGRNGAPESKCADFIFRLDRLAGAVDIALMKWCFVDIDSGADPSAMLERYSRTVREARQRHPGVAIVHVTVPLTVRPGFLKRHVKAWLGREDDVANLRRCEFNRLLAGRYAGEPVFDLAAVESTGPDGRRNAFPVRGATAYGLLPGYASDSGHLNADGRRAAARELLRVLAAVARARR